MSVPLLRRVALLLVLVSLVTFRCQTYRKRLMTFCDPGRYSKAFPLICIDDSGFPHPDPAHVFDVQPDANNKTTGRPVVVHWSTQHPGNLNVTFTDDGCTQQVKCNGVGDCIAIVKPLGPPPTPGTTTPSRKCSYSINLGKELADPPGGLIVDPCCWATP
ncbi:MAG TPA: hypothetical protein VF980_18045 [Thermoanaerobaculia bacterium]